MVERYLSIGLGRDVNGEAVYGYVIPYNLPESSNDLRCFEESARERRIDILYNGFDKDEAERVIRNLKSFKDYLEEFFGD
jgi:hypothetical protein